jgi:acetyl esterase
VLDTDAQASADALKSTLPGPLHSLGIAKVRELLTSPPNPAPTPEVHSVEDRVVTANGHDVPVRVYRPDGSSSLPALLYIHGGGWSMGTLEGPDALCRELCVQSGSTVVSIGYRLAPEHPFPAGLDDCIATFTWLHSNAEAMQIDPTRIGIGGDSAGGNLAIAVCLAAKASGSASPCYQLLAYPVTDFGSTRGSWTEHADAPLLTAQDAIWFMSLYAEPEAHSNPLVSPLGADSFAGLPPAHVITADVDVLRDDAEAYAERLRADGVSATISRYPGVFHGFFTEVGVFDRTTQAIADAAHRLRHALSSPTNEE